MTDWRPSCSLDAITARSRLLRTVRTFFEARGVLEVQTPLLGAGTVTEPAVESIAVPGYGHLQTSPEYAMKRLLCAGAPSIYQLAPVFRAGEAGRRHNPEFVMLEWYRLGFSDIELMAEVAELVDEVLGPAPVRTLSYAEVVNQAADLDVRGLDEREALDLRVAAGLDRLGPGRCFVTDYPADQAALARLRRRAGETVAARFELVVDGLELANGYWELGDAAELADRFRRDLALRQARGQAQPPIDERFLEAMRHGLPSCAGVALGFDRLLMLRLGASSLAEVVAFPIDRA